MIIQTENYSEIRRRNKLMLVERAVAIYVPKDIRTIDLIHKWQELLVNGFDFYDFLNRVKNGNFIPDDITLEGKPLSKTFIGSVRVIDNDLSFYAGVKRKLLVRVENYSDRVLQTTTEEPQFVSYHWYCSNGEVCVFDGVRTPLLQAAPCAGGVEVSITLISPIEPGVYKLIVTMVYEGRYWMEKIGMDVDLLECMVQEYDELGLPRHARSVFRQLQTIEKIGDY